MYVVLGSPGLVHSRQVSYYWTTLLSETLKTKELKLVLGKNYVLKKIYTELYQNQYEIKNQSWLYDIWIQILAAGIYIALISFTIILSDVLNKLLPSLALFPIYEGYDYLGFAFTFCFKLTLVDDTGKQMS